MTDQRTTESRRNDHLSVRIPSAHKQQAFRELVDEGPYESLSEVILDELEAAVGGWDDAE